jgi:cell wall-associated NlpC family hydrolase
MTLRIILIICTLLFSNGAQSIEQNDPVQQSYLNDTSQPALKALPDAVQNLLQFALQQVGVSYRRGGTSPETGFDCSGFVGYVFDRVEGITLPHSAMAISQIGKRINLTDLNPGDLVFFHLKRHHVISHVGIYLGNNQFVHDASNRTGGVRISNLTGYWARHFKLARRLDILGEQSEPEQ